MPLPLSTLSSVTASGDAVTAPGALKYLNKGLPIACLGDVSLQVQLAKEQ